MHEPSGGVKLGTSLDFGQIKRSRLATFLSSPFQYKHESGPDHSKTEPFQYWIITTSVFECVSIWVPTVLYFYVLLNLCKPTSWLTIHITKMYSNHLITKHLNTGQYGCAVFKWLNHVTWQFIWILNILDRKSAFSVQFQTTIWVPDHLTTGHKSTIQIPD